jgi:hypothetical protein
MKWGGLRFESCHISGTKCAGDARLHNSGARLTSPTKSLIPSVLALYGRSVKDKTVLVQLRNLSQISFFLRNSIGRRRNQLKTEGVRLSGKVFKKSISVLLFVSFLTDVDVLASQLDHAVDQKCEFVGDRGNTFRYA